MSDQIPEAPGPGTDGGVAGAEGKDENCTACLGARSIMLALAFAAFAAYCAADFATGGRVTAAVVGQLAALRGRAEGVDGER